MIINRQNFRTPAALKPRTRSIHNFANSSARFFVVQIFVDKRRSAAGIHQMIEARAVDIALLHHVEHIVNFAPIQLVDSHAQAHFYACVLGILQTLKRTVERAWNAAELIVSFARAIKRNAHIRQPHLRKLLSKLGRYKRAVR